MHESQKPKTSILIFLFSFANMLGLLYVPALPELTQYFEITKPEAQSTITYYLLGCILAQILYPPLAKGLGRKAALYIGGSVAIFGVLLCLISVETHAFPFLLLGRILTATGAACGPILTNTMLSDSYSPPDAKKILSYLLSAFIVVPSIGVAIGGVITNSIGWKGCFYFMFFYAAVIVFLCTFLPETAKEKNKHHLNLKRIAKSYFVQICNVQAVLYSLIAACSGIIIYLFSSEAPFIAKHNLSMPANHFGFYNLIPNFGFFLGGLASAHLSHRLPFKILIPTASICFLLFSSIMVTLFEIGFVTTATLFGIPFLIFFVAPIILSNAQMHAINVSEDKPYAASFSYILLFLWCMLGISAFKLFSPLDLAILPIVYAVSGTLMILLWAIVKHVRRGL